MTSTDARQKWVPRDDTFGARLALVRQRFGWNMKEASLACGLPQNSWLEWEINQRVPRNLPEVAEKISEYTGADDYWLITGRMSGDFPSGPTGTPAKISKNNELVYCVGSTENVTEVDFTARKAA